MKIIKLTTIFDVKMYIIKLPKKSKRKGLHKIFLAVQLLFLKKENEKQYKYLTIEKS